VWGDGCGVSANEYSCAHGARINFGHLTQNVTYGCTVRGRIGDRGLLRNEGRGRMRSSIEKGWGTGMMSDRGLLRYCMREQKG
jgi:hypothetical protein